MAKRNTIWVFFGLIASGKSTVAEAWASKHQISCFNSDKVRKELAGVPSTSKHEEFFDQGIYSKEFTGQTYEELLSLAEQEIVAGRSVVLDASYQTRLERDRLRNLALRLDVGIVFVYCFCSPDVVKKRLDIRIHDPDAVSDGSWEIYQVQRERFEAPDELDDHIQISLSTERPVKELLDQLEKNCEV